MSHINDSSRRHRYVSDVQRYSWRDRLQIGKRVLKAGLEDGLRAIVPHFFGFNAKSNSAGLSE